MKREPVKFRRILVSLVIMAAVVSAAYGLYEEVAPEAWFRVAKLAKGMGWVLGIVGVTMAGLMANAALETADRIKSEEANRNQTQELLKSAKFCTAVHEEDFYAIWTWQVKRAQRNIDVTHLGPKPPQCANGTMEKEYYESLKGIISKSAAQVRRVERITEEKIDWIESLLGTFEGVPTFSLAIYRDSFEREEMPAAISVCRVDDSHGWIVALAEQNSTESYRDLWITAPEAIKLLTWYFDERLWKRSVVVLERGVVKTEDWEGIRDKKKRRTKGA